MSQCGSEREAVTREGRVVVCAPHLADDKHTLYLEEAISGLAGGVANVFIRYI
jgi:hypothetical protein